MCIISLVLSESKAILSFNRDEDNQRPFSDPEYQNGGSVFCPLDLVSGGTWIGANQTNIMCIQNGADTKHIRNPPYDKSRGLILLELLMKKDRDEVFAQLKNLKIEPFSIFNFNLDNQNSEIVIYDGKELKIKHPEKQALFIRCSATLYSPQLSNLISKTFFNNGSFAEDDVLNFHTDYRIGGSKNNFLSRPATSSITQFVLEKNKLSCRFINLISKKQSHYDLR